MKSSLGDVSRCPGSALVSVLAMAGCAAPPPPAMERSPGWPPADPAQFDPLDPDAVWSGGDAVRYRIESNATGVVRGWELELSTPTVPRAEFVRADPLIGHVRVAAYRQWRGGSNRELPDFVLYTMPVELRVKLTREQPRAEWVAMVEAEGLAHADVAEVHSLPTLGVTRLLKALLAVDMFSTELMAVVQAPSAWSVALAGFRVQLSLDFGREARSEGRAPELEPIQVDSPVGAVDAFWLPMTILANGQPALVCRMLITWRQSPLLPCAGVLRIEAHHPEDPARRVEAWLVSARRGPDAQPDPEDLGLGLRVGMTLATSLGSLFNRARDLDGVQHPETGTELQRVELLDRLRDGMSHAPVVALFREGRLWFAGDPEDVELFLHLHGYSP